jgi:hypothetical protein
MEIFGLPRVNMHMEMDVSGFNYDGIVPGSRSTPVPEART